MRSPPPPAVIVGLAAEARIARRLGCPVAISGGTAAGAQVAAQRMVQAGATGLISFGLAGGLDPTLRPGMVLIASEVLCMLRRNEKPDANNAATTMLRYPTDVELSTRLGGATGHVVLGADLIVAQTDAKQALWQATGAAAVDLESGAVARVATQHGVPFAVLRAICDPASRDLPPAALIALDQHGTIGLARVIGSVLAHPTQLPGLLALAADAIVARRSLRAAIIAVGRISAA